MEKKIKIKSTSLSPLNEALQKLKLNDKVVDFTPVIVEADGKFTSIMNTKEEFNPNDLGSAFETEEVETEEQKETKEQLLNKAKDALKQTLTNSKELNDILAKIQELSKEAGYNTWELNKEKNAATLKSKNAQIFKQNNNLCLSHSGKIELFHSVEELHDWLKEKGYPLPGNDIVIHESVEIKEDGRNWVDLLNTYNDKKKANPDEAYRFLDKDKYNEYNKEVTDFLNLQNKIYLSNDKLVNKEKELQKELNILDITANNLSNKIAVAIPGKRVELQKKLADTEDLEQKERIQNSLDQLEKEENLAIERLNEIRGVITKIKDDSGNIIKQKEIGDAEFTSQQLDKAHQDLLDFKNSEDYKKYHDILTNPEKVKELDKLRELLNIHDMEQKRYDKIYSNSDEDILSRGLGKRIDKQTLQADRNTKPVTNPNRKFLQKDADVDECCGGACVGTAALGPAVAYTANRKKEEVEEDEELQEGTKTIPSIIPGDVTMFPGRKAAVWKFLTWYKRNKPSIESGKIKLDKEEYAKIFDELIEPTFTGNNSDSVSKVWLNLVDSLVNYLAPEVAAKNNIPLDNAILYLKTKPTQSMCSKLSKVLNSYIPDTEEYAYGKVNLIPGVSISKVDKNNPNYQQRQNWQKAYYSAKHGGVADSEVMVKTFNDFKNFIKGSEEDNEFTPEQLALIKKYNLKPIETESTIFESAKNHPWLNKILGQKLTEDDSPADFATGSPISSDMSNDSVSTSSTTSDTTTTSTPDIDLDGSLGGAAQTPGFGDININNGYSPDEPAEEVPVDINMPEYKIIDVLMNDDDNDIKVKVQNTDTKETEIKNLEDIDV